MAMQEEFVRSGNWLFRWRSYLPLAMIGLCAMAMRHYHNIRSQRLDYVWEALCLTTSFTGLAVRILTIGHTPKGTSGRNTHEQVADSLNTTGIYSIVRNPLYLGNFIVGLGIVLFPREWWLVVIYALIFWLYYERIIFAEEAFLRAKFGDAYLCWAAATPAFIPRFGAYRPADLPFSFKNVLRREYNGFFVIIVALAVQEAYGDYLTYHKFIIDGAWTALLVASAITWGTLRMLKRSTSLLHVQGR
ncbi:MAG: hypothetical protein GC162_20335 [Planctomycetes bacterium]|nr:hypothetical protein [Planctomycetota bacterium]